jgi:hypothetical protein
MRRNATGAPNWIRGSAFAAALSVLVAMPAGAQLVFDGNILFNNGNGTLAGQFTGTAGIGAPSCVGNTNNLSAEAIGTLKYLNNTLVDPLLSDALDIVNPNWRPGALSPAFSGNAGHVTVEVPNDGFLVNTCYNGALSLGDDWTQGWTYYDSLGAGRDDLHLAGMTDPRPLLVVDQTFMDNELQSDGAYTMTTDNNYLLRGMVAVRFGGTLTIKPGVVIFEERATVGTLQIKRAAKIVAEGKPDSVIIITTDAPPGEQVTGGIGGLFINGLARNNVVNSCAGDSAASEGGNAGHHGGDDDADSSGVLRYVRIEYAGAPVSPNNESNSFTFNSVGNRTVCEYLQSHRGKDDLFEWFGGVGQARYLVGTDGDDDGLDWQLGYRGKVQFAIIRLLASNAGAERGIEADNNEFDNNTLLCSGRSNPSFANLTLIGDRRSGTGLTGVGNGIILRRGTAGQILNSIVYNFKTQALNVNGDATFEAHCATVPANPSVYDCQTVDAPVVAGSVFVTRGYPNPFRQNVSIVFTLPQAGDVNVEMYDAGGRLLTTLASGRRDAGKHTVTWNAAGWVPSGLYFYKVRMAGQESVGRVVRVD